MLGPKYSYSSNKMAENTLQRVPFLCSLWCSGLFWLRSSPLPQNRSPVLYSEGGAPMLASYSSFWLGKSWRLWAPWSCDHARQIPCLPSETKKKIIITTIIRFLWFCDVQTTSKCPFCVHWVSNHGCHLPGDQALLQPAASLLLLLLKHLWLLRRPPPLSGAALLHNTTHAGLGHKWCQHTLLQLDSNPCICQLPCLRSLRQNRSYHSCHLMKRRRSPWGWVWSCDSSSNPFWSMEFEPPVSEEWQRQKSGHLWPYMIESYIWTVEKNPCIFSLKAQPGNRVKKKNILSIFDCFWKT